MVSYFAGKGGGGVGPKGGQHGTGSVKDAEATEEGNAPGRRGAGARRAVAAANKESRGSMWCV